MLVPRSFLNSTPPALPPKRLIPILRFSVMLIGYMRVSSSDERQVVDLQLDALLAAGVDERYPHQDKQSGGRDDRAGLKTRLAGLHAGDVLVVWKLDRLGRSLSHLVRILEDLKGRGVAFRSLTEGINTTTSHGLWSAPRRGRLRHVGSRQRRQPWDFSAAHHPSRSRTWNVHTAVSWPGRSRATCGPVTRAPERRHRPRA